MRNDTVMFAMGVVIVLMTVAPAAADHDTPSKAASAKIDLVRAYAPCTVPNDIHDQVVVFAQACSPAVPFSTYTFGPAGKGTAQVQRTGNGLKLRFDVKDVRTAGNQPADGVTFAGQVRFRLTDHGCSAAASCTLETFLNVSVPCSAGHCFVNQNYPGVFLPIGLEGAAEITQVDVLDDGGNRFATEGILFP